MVGDLSSNWKVRACYEFMPDPSRYEDNDILAYMRFSCVIIVGISPSYLHSNRWEKVGGMFKKNLLLLIYYYAFILCFVCVLVYSLLHFFYRP